MRGVGGKERQTVQDREKKRERDRKGVYAESSVQCNIPKRKGDTQRKILHVSCVSRRGLSTRTHTHKYRQTERQIDSYRYRYTRTLELLMHTNYYNDISSLSKTRESEKAEAEPATHRGAMSWQLAAIGQAQKQQIQQQQQQQQLEETTTTNNDDIARHKAKSQMTGNVSLSLT